MNEAQHILRRIRLRDFIDTVAETVEFGEGNYATPERLLEELAELRAYLQEQLDAAHSPKPGTAEEALSAAEAENAKLRGALDSVMIGHNHLVAWLPANVPEPETDPLKALGMIGAGVEYDVWCCWRSIMLARAALNGDKT